MTPRKSRKRPLSQFIAALACAFMAITLPSSPGKEYLTDKEIELIQENHAIDVRVKLYLEFAAARLKVAEERLTGKESKPGDPFEFFMPEEMVDGYSRILESVMMNIDDAYQNSDVVDRGAVRKGLRLLKTTAENAFPQLEILKRIAEEKRKEDLWNLIEKAIEISKGAHEGAVFGLGKLPDPDAKRLQRK